MTAPDPMDPLVCINTRLVGGDPTCNQLESDHCEGCRMCPGLGNCICRNATPLDKAWLAAALDAFAQHGGAANWAALCDVISHSTAEHHRADVAAAIDPLQAEIRRLTASPSPARLPSARELVVAWNRRTDEEKLTLAAQMLADRRFASVTTAADLEQFFTTTDSHGDAELRYIRHHGDAKGEFVSDADGSDLATLIRDAERFTPTEENDRG